MKLFIHHLLSFAVILREFQSCHRDVATSAVQWVLTKDLSNNSLYYSYALILMFDSVAE